MHCGGRHEIPHYNVDNMAGVDYRIDPTRPEGSRIRDLRFGGMPLDPEAEFVVACNSYRTAGGGLYPHLETAEVVWRSSEELPDLIGNYLEKTGRGCQRWTAIGPSAVTWWRRSNPFPYPRLRPGQEMSHGLRVKGIEDPRYKVQDAGPVQPRRLAPRLCISDLYLASCIKVSGWAFLLTLNS